MARQVSLELGKEIIQGDLSETKKNFESLDKEIGIQQLVHKDIKKRTFSIEEERKILEKEIQELDREILDSKRYVEKVEILIKRLNLDLDINKEDVQILKGNLMEKSSYLDLLRNEIINFEIALDTLQTSALLAEIKRDIKDIEKQVQKVKEEQEWLNDWRLYFDGAHKELKSLQNQALKEYTTKFGPLTSTIQRKLRPVYGFGDMELYPEEGGIAVRVEKEGKRDIPPSDYFSESQIQIVMLSLFLSAALTQTWSSFAPILLDDPVTHFDDLNAYSLIDLIRNFIMHPDHDKRPQFIISTCEERLFRLMRQKFNKLNNRTIFYVFESIGENGPKIKKEIL
ncbi:MAG: hypothetical protein QME42_07235 [bacterium]|nr:hypothetical protein [bacterium]